MADFAQRFPTTIFLELMGLPVDELDQFLEWEHAILHTDLGQESGQQQQIAAMMAVMGRFSTIIAERREQPATTSSARLLPTRSTVSRSRMPTCSRSVC
ncbi:putative cytochrome P450 [Mycobacterium xenopi 4042]|uniref:Putative cytochrome P450 n=1 Tax=Mycobacterium xenopi 4042 TaxID=1299334 RepID=X8AI81_MYCXE|nr:putative cytochrome P450 [Mycobacterium xenopi 4042]